MDITNYKSKCPYCGTWVDGIGGFDCNCQPEEEDIETDQEA